MKLSLGADTLAIPSPVWVVGSYNASGKPNLITISWAGVCCSDPPCVAIAIRKNRQSHANILHSSAFSVNLPAIYQLAQTDLIGMVSGASSDKFSLTGLTAISSELVHAPYVQEFPLNLECSLLQSVDLGSHTQFIGRICDVKADEKVLGRQGLPIAGLLQPLLSSAPERSYYALGRQLCQASVAGKSFRAVRMLSDQAHVRGIHHHAI